MTVVVAVEVVSVGVTAAVVESQTVAVGLVEVPSRFRSHVTCRVLETGPTSRHGFVAVSGPVAPHWDGGSGPGGSSGRPLTTGSVADILGGEVVGVTLAATIDEGPAFGDRRVPVVVKVFPETRTRVLRQRTVNV